MSFVVFVQAFTLTSLQTCHIFGPVSLDIISMREILVIVICMIVYNSKHSFICDHYVKSATNIEIVKLQHKFD